MSNDGGRAILEGGAIVIRVSLEALPMVLEGAWAMGKFDTRYKITDAGEFAKELTHALNSEGEDGTTSIHRLFDQAILDCLESGAFGIDEESATAPDIDHRPHPHGEPNKPHARRFGK